MQAFQQFFADLWQRFNSEWFPAFWQWLLDNPMITIGLSAVFLLWACIVIRKSTHDGWTFARVLLMLFLFGFGFAAIAIVLHLI